MRPPTLIGIAGCSGSGKTWLAQRIKHSLGDRAAIFSIDWYYRDLSHLTKEIAAQSNFDLPSAIEKSLMLSDLEKLASGSPINAPVYDFSNYTRLEDKRLPLSPTPYIIVEGIFALHFEELVASYQESVFVDTPFELCFQRRLQRDKRERGYTEDQIRQMWSSTVPDSYRRFVKPSAARASRVWNSEEDKAFVKRFLADLEAYSTRDGNTPTDQR